MFGGERRLARAASIVLVKNSSRQKVAKAPKSAKVLDEHNLGAQLPWTNGVMVCSWQKGRVIVAWTGKCTFCRALAHHLHERLWAQGFYKKSMLTARGNC